MEAEQHFKDMKKAIIGLGSKARVGKDYAASQLKTYFDVERIAFADRLKDDLEGLFVMHNLNFKASLNDPVTKEMLRPLLVEYGQTMRKFNQDIWVDAALQGRPLNHQVTIITDVRFPNEVKRLKELGGVYIEIETDVPPANETEALYSPMMAELADMKVRNNFDGLFIPELRNIITQLLAE
jgi:hypothetical protein